MDQELITDNSMLRATRPRTRLLHLLTTIALVLLTTFSTTPAWAHAELLSSTPQSGAALSDAPAALTLRWSEVVPDGSVRVTLLASGQEVPVHLSSDVDTTTLHPLESLVPGEHVISWKVVSADGHLVSGLVPFRILEPGSVNTGPMVPVETSSAGRGAGPLDRAAEALSWMFVATALGASLARRRLIGIVASVLAMITASLRIWEIAVVVGGDPLLVGEGRAASAVVLASFVLLISCLPALPGRVRGLARSFAVPMFAAQSLYSGHHLGLAEPLRLVATAAHGAHLAAVLAWTAAVTALLLRRDEEQVRLTRRISTGSIAVLALAGPVLVWTLMWPTPQIGPWTVVLVLKGLVLGAIAVLAWRHHRLSANREQSSQAWRKSVVIEVAMFVVVALLSAALTSWSPPATATRTAGGIDSSVTVALPKVTEDEPAISPAVVEVSFNGGAAGTLEHDPATGRWTLTMASPLGTDRVELNAANPQAGIDGFSVTLTGDGVTFSGEGALPLEGVWQAELTFLADRFDLQSATTTIETGASS
jgi:copper transport protein